MEKSFLLDTDVLIDFFRGYNKAVSFVNRYSSRIILSSIGVAELGSGSKLLLGVNIYPKFDFVNQQTYDSVVHYF